MLFHIAYEKLWAAVTGGRGAGRGKKKVVTKGVDPELLKYGKSQDYPEKMTVMLPVLNSIVQK